MTEEQRTSGSPVSIDDAVMLIRIPQLFRPGMSDVALYEATRGHWRVGPRRNMAEFALAVHDGLVLEVFAIEGWQPAGTAPYVTRPERKDPQGRWEFVGTRAPEAIRRKYRGHSIKRYLARGNQNPIRYVNC